MVRSARIPKTLPEKVRDLDHHQFLLRQSLHGLRGDVAHLKTLAAELRTLLCLSSGTEGLLWRLADELDVSDELVLEVGGSVNRDHPLARGLVFGTMPLYRPGAGPPGLKAESYRLRDIIKGCEAVYLSSINEKKITHEVLIKAIAEQIGSAHEDEGIDPTLARLKQILLNGAEPYVPVLTFDAELALQVGERLLDHAEQGQGYERAEREAPHGDVTLTIRFGLREILAGRVPILTFRSHVSEAEIACSAGPQTAVFTLKKRGHVVGELEAKYPPDWALNTDALFAFSYSSSNRQARTITNDRADGTPVKCEFGWIDARELVGPELHKAREGLVYIQSVLLYGRLLQSKECGELRGMSPDLREMMISEAPQGPFPP